VRTTLDIDDDVLLAVRELAKAQNTTPGKVISGLVRKALAEPSRRKIERRHGFAVLSARGGRVTPELVGRLAEDDL
jgi:hypothetical protein